MHGGVLGVRRRTLVRVRSGPVALSHEPGTMRSLWEPSIRRAQLPISICGTTSRMERSEPLAGVSRPPSGVPDTDPRAGAIPVIRWPVRRRYCFRHLVA